MTMSSQHSNDLHCQQSKRAPLECGGTGDSHVVGTDPPRMEEVLKVNRSSTVDLIQMYVPFPLLTLKYLHFMGEPMQAHHKGSG